MLPVREVQLPKVRLTYVEQGERAAPPVILLHGLTDSWRSFELLLPYLPAATHVFALSQRGHGDSDKPAEGYRASDFAADVVDFLDCFDIPTAVIVGHSSHGLVAERLAVDFPERIAGLVLVSSFATVRGNARLARFVEDNVASLRDPVDPGFIRDFQQGTFLKPPPQAFFEGALAETLKVPAHVWRAAFGALLDTDHTPDLSRIAAPTLLVWGDADAIIHRTHQDILLRGIPGAELFVYEGVGHSPHWEEPRRFASDLVGFTGRI
jgi:pimeloyl-ACP methyl ester carboxylesterase